MDSFLPNLRWLCLPSSNLGRDWFNKAQQLDSLISELGFDLFEENVYLLFSNDPYQTQAGLGHCLIARPVVGPKRSVEPPLVLQDWTASSVWRKTLHTVRFDDILKEVSGIYSEILREEERPATGFIILIKRRYSSTLNIGLEVIFYR